MQIRCFLDTTYLMPLFGFDVSVKNLKRQLLQAMSEDRFIFMYSPVSLIEIQWQVIKLGRTGHDVDELEKRFSRAITSLKNATRWKAIDFVDAKINDLAFDLRRTGHQDYFDTVIASSALWHADLLVTEDEPLKLAIQAHLSTKGDQGDVKPVALHDWHGFSKTFALTR